MGVLPSFSVISSDILFLIIFSTMPSISVLLRCLISFIILLYVSFLISAFLFLLASLRISFILSSSSSSSFCLLNIFSSRVVSFASTAAISDGSCFQELNDVNFFLIVPIFLPNFLSINFAPSAIVIFFLVLVDISNIYKEKIECV